MFTVWPVLISLTFRIFPLSLCMTIALLRIFILKVWGLFSPIVSMVNDLPLILVTFPSIWVSSFETFAIPLPTKANTTATAATTDNILLSFMSLHLLSFQALPQGLVRFIVNLPYQKEVHIAF